MNILLISKNSPFESIGGIERYIDNLIAYFSVEKRNKLYLMLPSNSSNKIQNIGNVTIHFVNSLYIPKNKINEKKESINKSQNFSVDLLNIINENLIDIICAENFHTDLPPGYSLLLNMITMSLDIPLVLQLHSFAVSELQTEIINQLKWDRISCVSKSVAGDCFQKGLDINSISTHYLGVNTDKFNLSRDDIEKSYLKNSLTLHKDTKIILTATRIIRGKMNILQEKGIINLIEAFSKLSPRYQDLYLLIAIGKPPENLKEEFGIAYEMLQGYIKLHNVEEKTILKMYSLDEMPDIYRGSDVFVLASENETFGQVFLEAMSCGIPVIGTKVGGIPEIISDSYNGYLIPASDASVLAQKIEHLLNSPQTRIKFISAGLKTVKNKFTSRQQILNFGIMLEEVYSEFVRQENVNPLG